MILKFCYNKNGLQGGTTMDSVLNFFRSVYAFIKNQLSVTVIIYLCIAILVLILVWIIMRMIKRKKASKRLSDLEIEMNEISNNSLAYKFNKASAFARVNDDIMDKVKKLTPKYDTCQNNLSACDDLFNEADDYVSRHRLRKSMRAMDDLETMMDETKERIRIVTQSLDHILARETEVRESANALKERFRNVKTVYQDNRSSFYGSVNYVDSCLEEIENEFSNFEEWMFASEFNKAKEEQEKISKMVDEISSKIAAFPGLYEKAKNVLPRAINEVRLHIKELQEKDIDLSYLEPEEKLTTIQNALASTIDQLDAGEFELAQENLEIIGDHILALQDDVTNEKQAYEEIHVSLQSNLDIVNVIGQELEEIMALYANIKDRFGLEDWTHRFSLAKIQMEDLEKRRDEIQNELKQNQRPSVDVVHGYRKFSEDVNEFHDQVKDMKEMLVGASSDESRAKKQLTKLQLILNEVRLNTVTRHLPSISSQFSADLKEGERLIQRVRIVLDHSPLDVQTLNADLQDAIDFVYKLYNNANNLVGVAVMVENAIVFGNRFRSTHAQMDSDLTRAELCFQNGEYTRALKIAIQAIENMHPGIYEKLVAQKDPAVMNQVQ